MINQVLRWSFTKNGWQYRLEMIPRQDSYVPTFVPATDIVPLSGVTVMPDTSLVSTQGLKEKREYDKGIPYGMQLAAEVQVTLDYGELTTAQQEVIVKPAVNIGSNGGIDYILTNVWTLKTDRGSGGATWYVEGQYCQRRTPEQEFTYDLSGVVVPTDITVTLHDIRRVVMERCEIYTSAALESPLGQQYTDYYIASESYGDFYSKKTTKVGNGLSMWGITFAQFRAGQQALWQTLYQYLCRDTAAAVSFMQPYGQAITLFTQSKQYHNDRTASSLTETQLNIISSIYPSSLMAADAAERLAGAFSQDEDGLLSDSVYSWDLMRLLTEWAGVKDCFYITEALGSYTLNLEYYPLLEKTRNSSVRALSTDDIVGENFKMKKGGGTIRKVEYVNKGSVDDDREAIIVENKGSISENGWSIQGVFSIELDMYERYLSAADLGRSVLYDGTKAVYFAPFELLTTGINQRKLLVKDFSPFLTIAPPHPTPDIDIGFGSVTIGSTGAGYPPALSDLGSSFDTAGVKSEADIIKAVLDFQDSSSYGNALARVILFLFGNEDNRLWSITVDFDAAAGAGLLPENIGDAYQIPAGWLTTLGGSDRAILVKCSVDWIDRTMECEFLNVYDTDITGA